MTKIITTERNKKQERLIILVSILVLAVVSVLIMLPFMLVKTKIGHDIIYHFGAIYSLREALENGSFGSRIYEYTCMDYGYGTGLFYTMIPSSIAAIFMKIFGLNAVSSVSLELILLLFISGIICFFFFRQITERKWLPLILSVLYLLFPYIICNIYTRFAFSELFITPLVPLIAWSLYEFVQKKNYGAFAAMFITAFSLCIMIHLSLTIYLALFAGIYLLMNLKKAFSKKSVLVLALSCIMVLVISATFTIPMFVNYGEITLSNMASSGKELYQTTYDFANFNEHYYLQAAILIMFALYVVYLINFIKVRKRGERGDVSAFAIISTLMFFCSPLCFLWLIMGYPPFNMIQFIWRLYLLGALASVYMFLKCYEEFVKNKANHTLKQFIFSLFCVFLLCTGVISNVSLMVISEPFLEPDCVNRYTMISSFWGCGGKVGDYMPNGATSEKIEKRIGEEIIFESNVNITEFANYKSQKILSFFVRDSKNGYVILKIPYSETANLKVLQKERDEPFSISELSTTEYEFEDTKYLKISFNDSENARIILDYEDSKNLKEYLDQNPFEFKVKNKTVDVKFTNFVKENSHTYQVDIETSDMVVVELPTLYYKSYKISLKTETGTKELKPVHGEDGLIEVNVSESGTLVVEFEGNYIKAANIVSICGVVCGVALVVSLFIFEKRAKASKKNIKNYKNKLKK